MDKLFNRLIGIFNAISDKYPDLFAIQVHGFLRYFIAASITTIALVVRLSIAPIEAGLQYITFFPAVTVAAMVGGYRAGLFSTVLGIAFATFIFTPPHFSISIEVIKTSLWSNLVFLIDGAIVSIAIYAMTQYRNYYREELKKVSQSEVNVTKLNNDLRSTNEMLAQIMRKLQASEIRLSSIFETSPDAILILDKAGQISMTNSQVDNVLGYLPNELTGKHLDVLLPERFLKNHPAIREIFNGSPEDVKMIGGNDAKVLRKDGSELDVEINISPIQSDEGTFFSCTVRDISRRKLSEERIKTLAFHDQLTGLPNRTLMLDRLTQALTSSHRTNHYGALLFIDLDHFKTLNDTLGHDTGDELLKQVAHRLVECIRAGDTVARIGGDEFVALLADIGTRIEDAANHSELVGMKILSMLGVPFMLNHKKYDCTSSIGITLFNGEKIPTDELLKQADLAMYKAKNSGRNALRYFDPKMESEVKERAEFENDLRVGLKEQQFTPFYQAQVTDINELIGAEVLIRWKHPIRGLVLPNDFIPLAEETGLIVPLGQWVIESACSQLVQWAPHPKLSQLSLSVNVSAHQLHQADFVKLVIHAIESSGADPKRLKIELTESHFVNDVELTIQKLEALKRIGIGFSIDDFGTGYSSLSYLKRLPIEQIKIDRTFVKNILTDSNDSAIAKTIITLSKTLGLNVLAEGVELDEQRDFLTKIGCHAYQGYLFSRPIPIEEFESLVDSSSISKTSRT